MFRKSYRKLLRWNDEFPFAKFASSEDERPLLAVELPIAEAADADALGLALARILGIADRLLEETAGWLWLGGRIPDQGDRTQPQRGVPRPVRGRLPELLDADAPSGDRRRGRRRDADRRPAPPPDVSRRVRRRLGSVALAFVAAVGLLGGAGRDPRGPRRHAGPDDRRGRPLRRPARAAPRPGDARPDAHEPPHRHDDQALLLRPGVPRGPARRHGVRADLGRQRAPRRSRVAKRTKDYTLLRLNLAQRPATAARPPRTGSGSTCPTRAARRRATCASATRSSSFPVWAFAHATRPGQLGRRSSSRRASRSTSRPARSPRPTTDADGRVDLPAGPLVEPAATSSPTSSPTGRAPTPTTTRKATVDGRPGRGQRPGLARRRGLGQARRRPAWPRRCRSSASGSAWPGRRPRPLVGPGGGQPLDRRLCRPVRPGQGRRRDRLLRRRLRRPPRGRARLVQRLAARRPLGERGVRLVLRAPGGRGPQGQGRPATC